MTRRRSEWRPVFTTRNGQPHRCLATRQPNPKEPPMIAMIDPGYLVCGGMIALALLGMFVESRIPWGPVDDTDTRLADLAERVERLERAAQRAERR